MKVLVTGCAGFIGFHVARALLKRGDCVVGFDSLNDYYDPSLKAARLTNLADTAQSLSADFTFVRANLADRQPVEACFEEHKFDRVIHLAAQPGVRYSIENPRAYVESNLVAFTNVLEACRHARVPHLTYASTSSVYGANTKLPFSEHDIADHPLQFYAATKRANELMAHAYAHLYQIPMTGLRFFTVYGPWGRPDMALMLFADKIMRDRPIPVFNNGNQTRDFTYIDDIVEGIVRASDRIAQPDPAWRSDAPDPASSNAPFRIYNIGNSRPVNLMDYIKALETALGRKAKIDFQPMQPGELADTYADVSDIQKDIQYRPSTPVETGLARFAEWYLEYNSR